MALLNPKKRLFILDEPTTGLDSHTKRLIWGFMKHAARNERKVPVLCGSSNENQIVRLALQDKPALMVTSHDMDELNSICDSVSIMADGQIVAAGSSLDLKRKYGKGWTLTAIAKTHEDNLKFVEQFLQYVKNEGYTTDAEDNNS